MYLATLCPIAKSPHHLDDVNCKSDRRETFQRVVSICLSLVCGPSLRRPLRSNRLPCCAIDLTIPSPTTRLIYSVTARPLLCRSARALSPSTASGGGFSGRFSALVFCSTGEYRLNRPHIRLQ